MKIFNKKLFLIAVLFFTIGVISGVFVLANRNNDGEQASSDTVKDQNKFFLKSFYDSKKDYEEAFEGAKIGYAGQGDVLGGITSHHFLARQFIAEFFGGLSSDLIEEVYIVGPDHFDFIAGDNVFAYTNDSDWETPYGNMVSAEDTIGEISECSGIVNDRSIFLNEHSIYTLVPFAKKVLPNAKVVPIVLKGNKDYESFFELGEQFRSFNEKKKILVVSSDFSHDGDLSQTKQNDQKSLKALKNLDLQNIDDVVCDCRNCLAFALGFFGNDIFLNSFENKNSTDFGGGNDNVTSYMNVYFAESK